MLSGCRSRCHSKNHKRNFFLKSGVSRQKRPQVLTPGGAALRSHFL
nr:MAG TPA: hypothetical protein [Microviridae sp.]